MTGWPAAVDAACVRINPVLLLVAAVIALLDISAAVQRYDALHPVPRAREGGAGVRCGPGPELELSDMVGRD